MDWQKQWSARLDDKDSNAFDAIRLVLAGMVMLEHSFFLVENSYVRDPLFRLTGGQVNSGALAVYMFFAISGFLVTRSFVMSRDWQRYLVKRIARIVPGFLAASLLALLVMAPLAAPSVHFYFALQDWAHMLLSLVTLHEVNSQNILAGNALSLIHSTLWTIKYEFDCYLIVALLGLAGVLTPRRAWPVYLVAMGILCAAQAGWFAFPDINHGIGALLISDPLQWPILFPFFFAGSAFYLYRAYIPKSLTLALAGTVLLAVTAIAGGLHWLVLTVGVYALVYLALSISADLKLFGRRIDLSYGVYLYGWPVAQLLLFFTHQSLGAWGLFLFSLPLTLLMAVGSWYLVEYPSLRLAKGRRA